MLETSVKFSTARHNGKGKKSAMSGFDFADKKNYQKPEKRGSGEPSLTAIRRRRKGSLGGGWEKSMLPNSHIY